YNLKNSKKNNINNGYEQVLKDLTDDKKVKDIVVNNYKNCVKWVYTINGIEKIDYYKSLKHLRCWRPVIIYLYGTKGTGKSFLAEELFPIEKQSNIAIEEAFWKDADKWWDGYSLQEAVVLDDFNGYLQWTDLLRFTDRRFCQLNIKGRKVNL